MVQTDRRKVLQGLLNTESLLGCCRTLLLSAHPALARRRRWDTEQDRSLVWRSIGIFVFLLCNIYLPKMSSFLLVSQGGSCVFTHQEWAQDTTLGVISACLSSSSVMVLTQPRNGPPSHGQVALTPAMLLVFLLFFLCKAFCKGVHPQNII